MTLSEVIKSIFYRTKTDLINERQERIKGDDDRTEYKHIVHVELSGDGLGDYQNNNLYFVVRNYDKNLIQTFPALLSNFEPNESIIIYNEELENTNTCVIKSSGNSISYSGDEEDLPIDIDVNNVIMIEDNCVQLS